MLLPLVCVFAACESRATLHIYPCYTEGGTQACTGKCGEGVKTCRAGSWSACVVPPTGLPCSDSCGEGILLCEDEQIKGVCQVPVVTKDCSSICGPGTLICANNRWQACNAPQPKQPKLTATIRDFHITFPDMNHDGIAETGIVANTLGADDKPVYAHTGPTATVSGRDTFDDWYNDVPGVNLSTSLDIPLTTADSAKGVYSYDNTSFFPIDNLLFGNEGQPHNYAFTAEIATRFVYNGGDTFTFSGDDDVFVFINRTLAIDLGGIHSMMSQTVDLDAQADQLGMVKGGIYPMHIFFAERHMTGSDFVVETTISEFDVCN
jgi:fibro-slime domain-containing protein